MRHSWSLARVSWEDAQLTVLGVMLRAAHNFYRLLTKKSHSSGFQL